MIISNGIELSWISRKKWGIKWPEICFIFDAGICFKGNTDNSRVQQLRTDNEEIWWLAFLGTLKILGHLGYRLVGNKISVDHLSSGDLFREKASNINIHI